MCYCSFPFPSQESDDFDWNDTPILKTARSGTSESVSATNTSDPFAYSQNSFAPRGRGGFGAKPSGFRGGYQQNSWNQDANRGNDRFKQNHSSDRGHRHEGFKRNTDYNNNSRSETARGEYYQKEELSSQFSKHPGQSGRGVEAQGAGRGKGWYGKTGAPLERQEEDWGMESDNTSKKLGFLFLVTVAFILYVQDLSALDRQYQILPNCKV